MSELEKLKEKGKQDNMIRISCFLPSEMVECIRDLALMYNVSQSELIRAAIEDGLNCNKKL